MLISSFAGNPFLHGFAFGLGAAAKKKVVAKKAVAKKAVAKAKTAVKAAKIAKVAAASAPKTVVISRDVAMRLQSALVQLGKVAGSATLKAIKVDGAPGAKTAAAVNLAFTKHIGAGQAPAQYRTGKLPLDYIKANATVLTSMIETEVRRRGAAVVPVSTVKKSQPATKASATAAAKKAVAAKQKATKAAVKKVAAVKKNANARQGAINAAVQSKVRKQKAAILKAQAAKIKKANPTAAKQLEDEAAKQEEIAKSYDASLERMNEEVRASEGEAAAAAQEQAEASTAAEAAAADAQDAANQAAAQAVAAQTQAVQAQAAAAPGIAPSDQPMVATLPPSETNELIPSGGGGESTFSKYKVPIIGAGVGLVGLLAILMMGKGSSASAPRLRPAPAMNGAYRRRSHRGRR